MKSLKRFPTGRKRLVFLVFVSAFIASSVSTGSIAIAKDTMPALLSQWYGGLKKADKPALANLLGEKATIELRDLGIVQNRAEFLDSMENWAEANKDATLKFKPVSVDTSKAVIEVCYKFPSNELHTSENFTFADGKIVGSVQQSLGEKCNGF